MEHGGTAAVVRREHGARLDGGVVRAILTRDALTEGCMHDLRVVLIIMTSLVLNRSTGVKRFPRHTLHAWWFHVLRCLLAVALVGGATATTVRSCGKGEGVCCAGGECLYARYSLWGVWP